jgi:hypothetical protein
VVLFWEKGGSFRMRRGAEMVVQPAEGVTEEVLRTGILGPGLATLLQQLGFLVLHGSAVVIAGKAVAFVGWKGQGKSTLAAALFARGITLLTDDLLALSTTDGSQVLAEPGFPQFKLWPDSVESSLGESPESLPRLTSHFDKRVRKLESGFALARVPLAAIYVLTDGPELRVQRFSPQETFQQLVTNTFCARYGRQVFQGRVRAAHFQNVARTAGKVPVFRLERPRALAGLGALSDFVVGHATGL